MNMGRGEMSFENWIENASYEDLLRRWRFGPLDDPAFKGETGKLFSKKLFEMQAALSDDERVAVSKKVGWGKF